MMAKNTNKTLRIYERTPVWICEYHQEVLPYIYRAIGSKHLPFSGITMVHLDSHPDLMAPTQLQADHVYDKGLVYDVVSIADWILPAVYAGHINKVVWVKPCWAKQIEDKILRFHVGRDKADGLIRVSCYERYFCEDGMYAPVTELENCKELVVVVLTMPFDVGDNATDSGPLSENVFERFTSMLSSQLEQPFILDIDMDFFSTLNPFQGMFSEEEFATLRNFYLFPPFTNPECEDEMGECSRKHEQNVKQLESSLSYLKNNECSTNDSSLNMEFVAFVKKWRNLRSEPVDYEMIHSAGMTTELPVHISDRDEVTNIMACLGRTLTCLPKPAIITVARSSDDDYTPPQSVEMIQDLLIKCLTRCYTENDIHFIFPYTDQE